MNRCLWYTAFLACFLTPWHCEAQISVEILDAPPAVYNYEPVFVTFEVRNNGIAPVVIPADTCSDEGAFLVSGRRGEELEALSNHSDCVPQRSVWLGPASRWLFFQAVALGGQGAFHLQAVLRSPGECRGRPVGPDRDRIKPARPVVWGARPYDCWAGEARSQRTLIEVAAPTSDIDLAAAEFLRLDHFGLSTNWKAKMVLNVRELLKRFPTSHYTYAAFFQLTGGGQYLGMLNMVRVQPDNSLNPWTVGAMAIDFGNRSRPCAGPRPEPPYTLSREVVKRYESARALYKLPEPLTDYLRQLELENAAEACGRPRSVTSKERSEPKSP